MTWKTFISASLLCGIAPSLFAAPGLTIVPGGIQAGNWVWDVAITPDLVAAGGLTPVNFELGFRLTGAPLLSASNINPLEFEASLPGDVIFGWETLYGIPPAPEGLEINCMGCTATNPTTFPPMNDHSATVVLGSANEIFAALGSIPFTTPGPKPVLRIVVPGPGEGYLASTIQWLGAYNGNGRISQLVGISGQNFDIYSGTATQFVPEPTSALLMLGGALVALGLPLRTSRI